MTQSKTTLWIAIAVVLVIIFGGIWWYGQSGTNIPTSNTLAPQSGQSGAQNTQGQNAVSAQNNSDASLNQDLSSLDTQLNSLSADSQSVHQGLNDEPIPQGQ